MYLSFPHVFSWFDSCFVLFLCQYSITGCTTVYLSIRLLDIPDYFRVMEIMNKVAANICVQVFGWICSFIFISLFSTVTFSFLLFKNILCIYF